MFTWHRYAFFDHFFLTLFCKPVFKCNTKLPCCYHSFYFYLKWYNSHYCYWFVPDFVMYCNEMELTNCPNPQKLQNSGSWISFIVSIASSLLSWNHDLLLQPEQQLLQQGSCQDLLRLWGLWLIFVLPKWWRHELWSESHEHVRRFQ